MVQVSFPATKSSLFAVTGSQELGGGQDDHLPVGGPWNGYTFRSAVQFAPSFAGMKAITSATLRMWTSSQVHVGFSSSPDIYVRRCTASWTANSASSGAEGGSGWSTSPTVYPGPAATTTGQTKRGVSGSEGAQVDIDVTAIVKAWAPATIPGGGGSPNYGFLVVQVASGDTTEFLSMRGGPSATRPVLIINYTTDSPPPAPTVTAPTAGQVLTTKRPTFGAQAVDPDGDPLEVGDVEVYQGAAVVWSQVGFAASSPTFLSITPGVDLPSGVLGVRFRARAAGVYGAWSAQTSFTIDRPPVVGAWSAPTGNISGTRRPVHTFAWSDPDADAIEFYDLEVYASVGGAPTGAAVYARANQSVGMSAASVSHTPTADLPGGPLLARSRVRARGVWSAWSAYQAYTVVLTVPTVSWLYPPQDGGFLLYFGFDATTSLMATTYRCQVSVTPPAGATITKVHLKITRLTDPGSPVILSDGDLAILGGGAGTQVYSQANNPTQHGFVNPYGALQYQWTVTASNGGVTDVTRKARWSVGEWFGSVALGDSATALASTETPLPPDISTLFYRAQASPTAAVAGQTWQPRANLASIVQPALPATNAYLGLYARIARQADDVDLLGGLGAMEWTATPPGWTAAGTVQSVASAFAVEGARLLRIFGDGATNSPNLATVQAAVPGATYRLTAWGTRAGGTAGMRCVLDALGPDGVTPVASNVILHEWLATSTTLTSKTGTYLVPADWSVRFLRVRWLISLNAAPNTEQAWFDATTLVGPLPGDSGMDKLALTWKSLG